MFNTLHNRQFTVYWWSQQDWQEGLELAEFLKYTFDRSGQSFVTVEEKNVGFLLS